MSNKIFISETFEDVHFDEDGEPQSVGGFISEKRGVTFKELVSILKKHPHPSSSYNLDSPSTWWSSGFEVEDYGTGAESQTSVHFHRENHENIARFWRLAVKFAGRV